MVALMDEGARATAVSGPDGSSGGIVRCAVSRRQNSYSHQRCYAARAGQQLGPQKAVHHQAVVAERADADEHVKEDFPVEPAE